MPTLSDLVRDLRRMGVKLADVFLPASLYDSLVDDGENTLEDDDDEAEEQD